MLNTDSVDVGTSQYEGYTMVESICRMNHVVKAYECNWKGELSHSHGSRDYGMLGLRA